MELRMSDTDQPTDEDPHAGLDTLLGVPPAPPPPPDDDGADD
jgi:hypothetical protein